MGWQHRLHRGRGKEAAMQWSEEGSKRNLVGPAFSGQALFRRIPSHKGEPGKTIAKPLESPKRGKTFLPPVLFILDFSGYACERLRFFASEGRRRGALVCLHLGSVFLWELDRGCGLNETGHSFLCNKIPVHIPHGERG